MNPRYPTVNEIVDSIQKTVRDRMGVARARRSGGIPLDPQPAPRDEEPAPATLNPETLRWADLPEVLTRYNEGVRLKVWDAITHEEIPYVHRACPHEGWLEVRVDGLVKVTRRVYRSFYFVDRVTGEEVRPPE